MKTSKERTHRNRKKKPQKSGEHLPSSMTAKLQTRKTQTSQ
jgi:hypothetical protein